MRAMTWGRAGTLVLTLAGSPWAQYSPFILPAVGRSGPAECPQVRLPSLVPAYSPAPRFVQPGPRCDDRDHGCDSVERSFRDRKSRLDRDQRGRRAALRGDAAFKALAGPERSARLADLERAFAAERRAFQSDFDRALEKCRASQPKERERRPKPRLKGFPFRAFGR